MDDSIICTPTEVEVHGEHGLRAIPWAEVTEVSAYRIDALFQQILYISLQHESGHVLEARDDMAGWPELISEVAARSGKSSAEIDAVLQRLSADEEPLVLFSTEAGSRPGIAR
jgi:hypothetical protein